MSIPPPAHPDPEVMAVEATIRKLTKEQWDAVRERLNLCTGCGEIDGGPWCCIYTPR